MTHLDVRTTAPPPPAAADPDLAELLRRSARGDVDAFMRFYDATVQTVFDLARLRHRDPRVVEQTVRSIYDNAYRRAADHAASDLSPRAWLLLQGGGRSYSTTCS